MSKVEGGEVRLTPSPLKASCNYFFFEDSRVNFHILHYLQSNFSKAALFVFYIRNPEITLSK